DVVAQHFHQAEVGRGDGGGDLQERADHVVAGGDGEVRGAQALGALALGGQERRAAGHAALDLAAAGGGRLGKLVRLGADAEDVRVLVVGVKQDQGAAGR